MQCLCGYKDMECVGSESHDDWAEVDLQCPKCGRVANHSCDGIAWLDNPNSKCPSLIYNTGEINLKTIKGSKKKYHPSYRTVGDLPDLLDPHDRADLVRQGFIKK